MFLTNRIARHLALVVVIISALVMGYIIYELSTTKRYFANRLIEQSSQQLEGDVDDFFRPVKNVMKTLKRRQVNFIPDDYGAASLNNYYIPIIKQYSQISSIGLADSRGYELNILPDSTTNGWLNREVYVDQWGMIEKWDSWKSVNDSLIHLRSWEQVLNVDPRQRPWFIGALKKQDINWTAPYIYMNGDVGLTASTKWQISATDTVQHVLAIDVTLEDLSDFSQQIRLTENNKNFILTSPDQNIIGLPQGYKSLSAEELSATLMTSPTDFGHEPLIKLLEHPENEIVSFSSLNEKWWGVVKPYSINRSQELFLAVLIPESDFSSEIDSTRNAVIGGFIVIFLLSMLLVRNQNKLKTISQELNETNSFIEKQKEHLFSEVHHRVKNNLAIIAALINIENMQSDKKDVQQMLTKTQNRIQSMSAVHEILYKSDAMDRVQVSDFVPQVIDFYKEDGRNLNTEIDGVFINVNQALTYSLVLNELLARIVKTDHSGKVSIVIGIKKDNDLLVTNIKTSYGTGSFEPEDGTLEELIDVLLTQLDGNMKVIQENNVNRYIITFKLEDKKGATSNKKV